MKGNELMERTMTSRQFIERIENQGKVRFEKGIYYWDREDAMTTHFSFSNTQASPIQYIGGLIKGKKGLVISSNREVPQD